MDARQLLQLPGELLHEVNAISASDFWSWQALAVLAIGVSMLFVRWRRSRRAAALPREGGAVAGVAESLTERLVPSALVCALAVAGYLATHAAGRSGGLLLVLMILGGVMLAIRLTLFILMRSLATSPQMSVVERVAGWLVWFLSLPLLLQWLAPGTLTPDVMAIPVAGSRVSLLDAIRGVVVLLLFIAVASYSGAFIERRVLVVTGLPIGLRVGIAKVARVLLVVMAILLGLNSVGMDLTAFTVIGGAVGVGLGFGLQRIASNFVSGFVLLGDRSIRPGDVITIGARFGVVRELRARYVVVRDRDGVDTLIPNENIITSEVINWSYADRRIRLKLPVQISYQDNPRQAMALMEAAAKAHPRVESDPAPGSRVMAFGESGIELELRFWIRDPEDGVNNVRSDLYLAIWDAFQAAAITIPYPQRDVHLHDRTLRAEPRQEQT